jgi:hypothetical protein
MPRDQVDHEAEVAKLKPKVGFLVNRRSLHQRKLTHSHQSSPPEISHDRQEPTLRRSGMTLLNLLVKFTFNLRRFCVDDWVEWANGVLELLK